MKKVVITGYGSPAKATTGLNFFDDIVLNNKHLFPKNTEFISIKDL